ncbi:YkuS family protein [Virgibacillus proomii]|uniref:YkuS family protein n=1 Tax=Virgibacillus proomii TaxID=84407 RepID=UPI001C10A752|nr:YkuS family protein [Virgibacillus proomii]MBU5266499.1 YkuS family protein [Virgibacillus proomii]
MARIGVEESLANVKEALMEMGHEVVDLRSEEDAAYCDCCIISGQDKDVMGITEAVIAGSVINAQGMSAEDVCQMVNRKLT